jgi:hypothetical protein
MTAVVGALEAIPPQASAEEVKQKLRDSLAALNIGPSNPMCASHFSSRAPAALSAVDHPMHVG